MSTVPGKINIVLPAESLSFGPIQFGWIENKGW